MAWRVRWSEPAWDGLQRQAAYIERDSPRYAKALIREAKEASRSLRQMPHRARIVPEVNNPNLRELIVHRTYRMLYQVIESRREVIIVAFIHGARLLENALEENS